jgi:hypothetical protein
MSLSLKESRAATGMAKVLYSFLPGSGSAGWKGHVTFATVAQNVGIGNFWTAASKEPAIARLLELTLEKRRDCFEPLILTLVKEGLKYRQKNGEPVKESEILTLNGLIKDVGFKFPVLWDPEFRKIDGSCPQFSGCRGGHVVALFDQKILIRYASRLAKNVAHRPARVCGLLLL